MKKFAGFTPQQQYVLLSKQGYKGPADEASMAKFLAASPAAASKMGEYAQIAQQRLAGKPMPSAPVEMNTGGLLGTAIGAVGQAANNAGYTYASSVDPRSGEMSYQIYNPDGSVRQGPSTWANTASTLDSLGGGTQVNTAPTPSGALNTTQSQLTTAIQNAPTPQTQDVTGAQTATGPTMQNAQQLAITNPMDLVTQATVAQVGNAPGTEIAAGTGQAGAAAQAGLNTVGSVDTADQVQAQDAATYDAQNVSAQVNQALEGAQAATGMVSEAGTVRGQLTSLMAEFENDGTPPWASGAMRNAMATMQARGLGASSMAGQAIVQAAMESAISIASQDAATVAQFEMQNLNNEQQMTIFNTQQRVAGLFSDQAAQNAALQFNAASENQTNQFFADLQSTVSRFNAQQVNAIRQFNAGEANAVEQFNAGQQNLRDQFNAQNSLIVAQANAQWRQNIELTNTAAQNAANLEAARAATGLTQTGLDFLWQRERDIMAFAFQSTESAADRDLSLLLADRQISADRSNSRNSALGYLAGSVLGSDSFWGLFS